MKSLIRMAKERKAAELLKAESAQSEKVNGAHSFQVNGFTLQSEIALDSANLRGVSIASMFSPLHVDLLIDNFLSVADSQAMYQIIDKMMESFYQLRGRKCLPLGGRVTSAGLIPADDVPAWLSHLMTLVHSHILAPLSLPRPNHALINVYEPGEGIMAHEDGPAYSPFATILSVGSGCVFDFVSKSPDRTPIAQAFLPVGSVLLFRSQAYEEVLHEFSFRKFDEISPTETLNSNPWTLTPPQLGSSSLSASALTRGRRISITLRHVPLSTVGEIF